MNGLWRDFLAQAREDWRLNERDELYPLVAAIIFVALVALGVAAAPILIGPWL